jgi:hypothetical protein
MLMLLPDHTCAPGACDCHEVGAVLQLKPVRYPVDEPSPSWGSAEPDVGGRSAA